MTTVIEPIKAKVQRSLRERFAETRQLSIALTDPLSAEDMVVQAMADASPTKWHLAHVTWFFETFVLVPYADGYQTFDERFNFCFNSYYESQGRRQPRASRGLLTRPSIYDVLSYRAHVDEAMEKLLCSSVDKSPEVPRLVEIGINHEQQHQELLLTDILALFAESPLRPAYRQVSPPHQRDAGCLPPAWISYDGGIREIGHRGTGYAFDNEGPSHEALVRPFKLADRLVTNGEWLDFVRDGGYSTPTLWLADGWATVCREAWETPHYWEDHGGRWMQMSLAGLVALDLAAPASHISYFEAEAFARWAGARLPTEFEWEAAAQLVPVEGNTLGSGALRPKAADTPFSGAPRQLFGDVWEWTQSAYAPYPGYSAPLGAIGEYNGKFMVSQQVLRGASCVTPDGHSRATYRNFFYPHQRWQFLGLRLAKDGV